MLDGSFDPRRNSFCNLIDFVSTGVDVPMEEGATPMDVEETDNHHHHHHHKKDKKKKKDHEVEDMQDGEEHAEEEQHKEKKKKGSKKDKKKKDKKKKKKHKEEESGAESQSDLDLDSDDDLSLGSVPMSSSEDDEDEDGQEEEEAVPALSQGVSKRASIADGLKGFQNAGINFQQQQQQQPVAPQSQANSKRRHTLGAALKGFQIDVGALQETKTDEGLENMTELSKNLPTLSIAGVKQGHIHNHAKRRQSAFDVFLKSTGKDKDQSEE